VRYWIVTGGSSGIGLQLVRALLAGGDRVCIWDIREPPEMKGLSFDCVDLTCHDAIVAASSRTDREVDCFVHCAGVFQMTSVLHDNLVQSCELAFRLHFLAFVSAVQALLPRFSERGAAVVAITSAGMDMAYPGTLAYGPSKAALQRAIEQLAVELGDRGIRVNGVSPGAIATDMTRHMWQDPEFARERIKHIALGRQAEPSAVSDAVKFLCSDQASYITGETLWVDGGVRHGMFQTGVRDVMKSSGEVGNVLES
jgi:NAD(P)-dependent dehydrogenase (short-subunit alcohol dehydrogenase family)